MKIQVSKRRIFYILLAIFLFVLLVARYVFKIEIPRMILTTVVIAMAMLGDRNETIAISFSCMPMHQAIDFYIAIAGCTFILIIKNAKRIRVGFPVVLIFSMLIWELFHCLVYDWSPILLITSVIPLIFIVVCLSSDFNDLNYPFIIRTMAIAAAFMGLLQIIFYIVNANGNLLRVFATLGRLGSLSEEDTLIGGAINPNTLGIINVLSMTGLLQIRTTKLSNKFDGILFFLLLVLGMLTQSKTFLVCLLLMFFMILANQINDWKKVLRNIGGAILISLLVVFVLICVFPGILADFIDRFRVEDITTGRGVIMSQYHEFITSNPSVLFFGIGLSDLNDKVLNQYNVSSHVPHNAIQEVVVAWGLLGLFFLVVLFVLIIYGAPQKNRRRNILNYIPLIIILAKCMAGQLLTSGYTMISLVFAYLSLYQDFSVSDLNHNHSL